MQTKLLRGTRCNMHGFLNQMVEIFIQLFQLLNLKFFILFSAEFDSSHIELTMDELRDAVLQQPRSLRSWIEDVICMNLSLRLHQLCLFSADL